MKLINLFLVMAGFFPALLHSQQIERKYYDSFGEPLPDSTGAFYYISDSAASFKKSEIAYLYYPDSKLYAHGRYTNPVNYQSYRKGTWKNYFRNGQLEEESFWKDGLLEGMVTRYRENGNVYATKEYKDGKPDGHFIFYYNNKGVKCDDYYLKGNFVTGSCYDSLGNRGPHFFVEQLPEFPGGDLSMMTFIQENFQFPPEALKKKFPVKS